MRIEQYQTQFRFFDYSTGSAIATVLTFLYIFLLIIAIRQLIKANGIKYALRIALIFLVILLPILGSIISLILTKLLRRNLSKNILQYKKLNDNWNAEPNAPYPKISIINNKLIVEFYLNPFIFKNISEGQKGRLTFINCNIYRLGSTNDEGFYKNQFRYSPRDIPWGEFYLLLNSDWANSFPEDKIILNSRLKSDDLKHYLFFFRDNTFECIAESYNFEFL